jgi:hypothetical protein
MGDRLPVRGMAGMMVEVDRVFDTQSRRFKEETARENRDAGPRATWAIPRDRVIGLEHLILLGHTERRREIWNNQCPCFLTFGSEQEARHRLDRFLLEAARWKGMDTPQPVEIEPGVAVADVGPFHFNRQGHAVRLNVDVSASLYRELLNVTAKREAWDWGEE